MQIKIKIVRDGQFYFLASLVGELSFVERVRLEPIPLGTEDVQAGARVLNILDGTYGDIGPSTGRKEITFICGMNGEEHLGETVLEGMVREQEIDTAKTVCMNKKLTKGGFNDTTIQG